jgi:hypothetical protein
VPRAFGHARSGVNTLNRVLARQEKEIIGTALEECYGQVSGPSGAATKLGLPAAAARVRALAVYQDFLALWKDADPDIPILNEAKAEYAKLH